MKPTSPSNLLSSDTERKPRVIVYSGADPRKDWTSLFYLNLFHAAMNLGRELGCDMVPLIDTRVEHERSTCHEDIFRILSEGPVDGILGIMLYESMIHWIEGTKIPHAVLFGDKKPRRVNFDYPRMMKDCFSRFTELGCRSVGLMIPSHVATSALLTQIDHLANSLGIKVNYEWIVVIKSADELTGYSRFCALWDLRKRPEGLLVFPDITARGVLSAIAELRVRVPQDLKLILHRNSETPYSSSVPCDWIQVSVEPLAAALFRSLETQWKGEGATSELLPFQLVKNE